MNYELITCLAIDDEPLALQQLASYVRKIPFLKLVGECQSAQEAREIINREMVDAIFCDINMPDLNGMDFVKSLAAPPLVVFTTAYAEYAIEGYKVDAVDYLLKPFGLDEFRRAANRLLTRLRPAGITDLPGQGLPAAERAPQPPTAHETVPEATNDGSLFVKTDGRVVKIAIDDIKYVEGMSEYLKIHIEGNGPDGKPQKPYVVLFSMKGIEERLPNYFMRIHRSYIINLNRIQEVNKNRVIMDADTYLPIGDLYKEALNNYISRNFLGR
jgi:DNA-binding LytR/AlgR family response regulator